jgi:hypothetical protein
MSAPSRARIGSSSRNSLIRPRKGIDQCNAETRLNLARLFENRARGIDRERIVESSGQLVHGWKVAKAHA